jgi:D-3-phosphoglycerate dehydrogenase
MARQRPENAIRHQIPLRYILADLWFACAENRIFFKNKKRKDFILPLKSHRKVALSLEAKERGIRVIETRDASVRDYAGSIRLEAKGPLEMRSVTGALLGADEIRITNIDDFPINVAPTRHMLLTLHRDMPGIIGKIGSLLGSFNVNIASMQVGRKMVRGNAVMVLSLDDPLPEGILNEITKVQGIREAYTVNL